MSSKRMLIVFESQQEEAEGKYQESIHKIVVYIRPATAHWLIGASAWARWRKGKGAAAIFWTKPPYLSTCLWTHGVGQVLLWDR